MAQAETETTYSRAHITRPTTCARDAPALPDRLRSNRGLEIPPMWPGVLRLPNIYLRDAGYRRLPNGTLQPRAEFHVLQFRRFPRDPSRVWGHAGNRPFVLFCLPHLTSSSPSEPLLQSLCLQVGKQSPRLPIRRQSQKRVSSHFFTIGHTTDFRLQEPVPLWVEDSLQGTSTIAHVVLLQNDD